MTGDFDWTLQGFFSFFCFLACVHLSRFLSLSLLNQIKLTRVFPIKAVHHLETIKVIY